MSEDGSEQQESTRPHGRPFNPLVNYVYYTAAVVLAFVLFYLFSYPAVIALMMYFVIVLIRDTRHVIRTYDYKFAKQAAVINLIYSMIFFVILVVNGVMISQGSAPLIWPEFSDLTSWTPLFIMGGIFGISNIKRMYGPA
jgi:small-conductance mechanosensitive channel